MPLPNIEIIFKELAAKVAAKNNGIVALILKDTVPATNPIVMNSSDDIPTTGLTADNIAEITRAWIGYTDESGNVNKPAKVIAYVIATDTTDYTTVENYLETIKWDYVVFPAIGDAETTAFATWIKGCRDTKDLKVKAVLPHTVGDHEGIINFDTDDIKVSSNTYTAAQYCSRLAGILAGTPLSQSATYAVLDEVDDVPHHTKTELNTLIDAGKLVLMNDGEKVKIARAINSLTTVTADKGTDWKKIKIVSIMDQIYQDVKKTYEDYYVGKVPNDYDDKCILITAVNSYLETLENKRWLDKEGTNSVGIDTDAQKTYLDSNNIDISSMKDQDIKEANTGSNVYLSGSVKILDAMEDLALTFAM